MENLAWICSLIDKAKEDMKNKTLIIVYNSVGFTKKIDHLQEDSDFFSNQEIGEIFDALFQMGIKFLPYTNELDFLQDILDKKLNLENLIIWNLSRQGSINNQKSLVTSFCDFMKIPYIGSSVYSMSLCRNKYHFQKILAATNNCFLPTYSIKEFLELKNTTLDKFILKRSSGSASRGMTQESSNLSFSEMKAYIKQHKINSSFIVQKYIPGYEIEVPLLQQDGQFKPLGVAGLKINDEIYLEQEILPEEMYESTYSFFDFENFALSHLGYANCEHIFKAATTIAETMELKDYARVDFRVDSNDNLYCFDIATTPYLTQHSTPNYLVEKSDFSHGQLLLSLLGAFNSNIDSH